MMSNIQSIQQSQLAGHTKLTAVTIGHGNRKIQFFAMLEHDAQGHAKLPQALLDKFLTKIAVRRGDAYTVG